MRVRKSKVGCGGKRACLFELTEPGGSVHTSTSFKGSGDDGVHATVNAAGGANENDAVPDVKSMR